MRPAAVLLALVALAGLALAEEAADSPLRILVRRADAVVLARVERTLRYDDSGVRVHRLRPLRVIAGRLHDPQPDVIEVRPSREAPPALTVGGRAVVLLRPGPPLTDFDPDLPRMACHTLVGGAAGAISVASDEEAETVAQLVRRARAVGGLDDAEARAARRQLAFAELASHNARLVADALVELRTLGLAPLTAEEAAVFGEVLRLNGQLEPAVHRELVGLARESRDERAAAVLEAAGVVAD